MSIAKFNNHELFDPFFGDWRLSIPKDVVNIKVDVKENKDSFLIHAEAPGIPKENLKIEHIGQHLKISGEIKAEKETGEKGDRYHIKERSFGKFERQFQLPKEADLTKISAKSENGILNITVPKKPVEEVKSNIIKIE